LNLIYRPGYPGKLYKSNLFDECKGFAEDLSLFRKLDFLNAQECSCMLLWGTHYRTTHMPISTKIFRVFVSSTFSDFVAERDALQSKVYPKLAVLCKAHGASFQTVDLRWGVSEQAAEDQRTMRICLGEIDRCRELTPCPNFILLVGVE
jgi:hypothetical protein